ncbi:MAG: DUF3696 domain-containing protein [Ignavibacteriales bacterium]|nr:DUF3696 domain-containing protein [Ignavibacteriales bacterium]
MDVTKLKFKVQNFRNLKDVEIEIKPITLLFGKNGSGKSSFLKSYFFFHKNCIPYPMNAMSPEAPIKFYLNDNIHLGSFTEICGLGKENKKSLILKFSFEAIVGKTTAQDHLEENDELEYKKFTEDNNRLLKINCEFEIKGRKDGSAFIKKVRIVDETDNSRFEFQPMSFDKTASDRYGARTPKFKISFLDNNELDEIIKKVLMADNEVPEDGIPFSGFAEIKLENFKRYLKSNEKLHFNNVTVKKIEELIIKYYFEIPRVVKAIMEDIIYLPGIREVPKRAYILKNYEIDNLIYGGIFNDLRGGASADDKEFSGDLDGIPFHIVNGKTVNDKLNDLIKKLGFEGELSIIQEDEYLKPQLKGKGSEKKYSLSESSSGLQQIIPILVKLLHYKEGTILIEQPELHLHPKLQAALAELFVDRVRKNKNAVIIETHSEHLIKKLQVLIARGELKQEDIAVYYFDSDSGEVNVKRMEMDERGLFIEDWPNGFFDDATNLTLELFEALKNSKKRKN